ncbi:DUF721 domain-containing protein [Limisalsivibrio acetivorans]|uniref:DUF721 domain-containing protein n=1 Tax=Limisalsivibrio acetivorans TaxID=1304888 RepID=UPI0003B68364|nr:DUF721 domain-containing protein [Limisalsivibrio acetivorans]
MKKVSELIEGRLAENSREYYVLARAWREAVGPAVSDAAMPVKMEGATLIVGVSDQMWLTELTFMKQDVLEQLAEIGMNAEDIRFVFRPKKHKEEKRPKPSRNPTDRELKAAKDICAVIEDDRIRQSAERAMEAYFTQYSFEEFLKR